MVAEQVHLVELVELLVLVHQSQLELVVLVHHLLVVVVGWVVVIVRVVVVVPVVAEELQELVVHQRQLLEVLLQLQVLA